MTRALAAELLGTLLLTATVVGSGIMGERLADGNAAVALLGNTLATSCMLFALIAMLRPVSGAHFNPLVTLISAARGSAAWRPVLPTIAAQFAGAAAGAILANAMFGLPAVEFAATGRSGGGVWLSEVVATFALVLTILGVAAEYLPAAAALVIGAGYWFTASTSFANPAVTLARALSDTFAGIAPQDVPAFVVAQGVGAALAWGVSAYLFPAPKRPGSGRG